MSYERYVFVSYKRADEQWLRWTRENFVGALRSLLHPAFGSDVVWMDEETEAGASWPQKLAGMHSRSKLMIAVLSREYFKSEWCKHELGLMLKREKEANLRTPERPGGLIIPVVIDDGDCFPVEVQGINPIKLHAYANPFMRLDSPRQEELAEELRQKVCPAVEKALAYVPAYDPGWEKLAFGQFSDVLKVQIQSQTTLPSILPGS